MDRSLNLYLQITSAAAGAMFLIGAPALSDPDSSPLSNQKSSDVAKPRSLLDQANLAASRGDYEKAIVLYEQVVEEEPNNASAFHMFARTCALEGDGDRAIVLYRKAIELDPKNAEIRNDMAVVLVTVGQLDEAIKALKTAVKMNPMFVAGHNNLGVALLRAGNYDEAVEVLTGAVKLQPRNAVIKKKLEEARRKSGKSARGDSAN